MSRNISNVSFLVHYHQPHDYRTRPNSKARVTSAHAQVTNCFPYYQNVVNEALVNNGFDCALLSAHAVTITSLRNHLVLSWQPDTPELLHQYSPLSLYTPDLKSVGQIVSYHVGSLWGNSGWFRKCSRRATTGKLF